MSQGESTPTTKVNHAREKEASNPEALIDESDLFAVLQHSLQGLTFPQANKDGGKNVFLETEALLEITESTLQMETNFVIIEAEHEVVDTLEDELVWNINNNQEKFSNACEKSKSLKKDTKQLDADFKTLTNFYLELVNLKESFKGKIDTKIAQLKHQNEHLELKHLQEEEGLVIKKEIFESLSADCSALEEKQMVELDRSIDIDQINQQLEDSMLKIEQLDAEMLAIVQKKENANDELVLKQQELQEVKQSHESLDGRLKEKIFNNCVLKQRVNDETKIEEQICVSKMSRKAEQLDDQNCGVAEQIQISVIKAEKLQKETAELEIQRQQVIVRIESLKELLAESVKSLEVIKGGQAPSILDSQKFEVEKKKLEEDFAAAISEQEKIKTRMVDEKKKFEQELARLERKLTFQGASDAETDDESQSDATSSFSTSVLGVKTPTTKTPSSASSGDEALPDPKRKKR